MAGKWGPRIESMYLLLKMGIFQPAMLVYQRVDLYMILYVYIHSRKKQQKPLKIGFPKRKLYSNIVFQPSIFRCIFLLLVSGYVHSLKIINLSW